MYDPSVGRWFTEDPIGFEGGDADLYGYVGNAPADAIDPTGDKLVVANTEVTRDSGLYNRIIEPIKDGDAALKNNAAAALEILDKMISSPTEKKTYRYASVDDLVKEIKLRLYIIAAAKACNAASQEKKIVFAGKDAVCSFPGSKIWDRTQVEVNAGGVNVTVTGIKLGRGVNPAEGIDALYKATTRRSPLKADCTSQVSMCILTGLRAYLSPDAFAALFKDQALIIAGTYGLNRFLSLPKAGDKQDLLPGDTQTFDNAGARTAEFANENTIYLGEGQYYAPGIGIKSEVEFVNILKADSNTRIVVPSQGYGKIKLPGG